MERKKGWRYLKKKCLDHIREEEEEKEKEDKFGEGLIEKEITWPRKFNGDVDQPTTEWIYVVQSAFSRVRQ